MLRVAEKNVQSIEILRERRERGVREGREREREESERREREESEIEREREISQRGKTDR